MKSRIYAAPAVKGLTTGLIAKLICVHDHLLIYSRGWRYHQVLLQVLLHSICCRLDVL